jgi:CubicO group peptidase (beta-lactamase class C family)
LFSFFKYPHNNQGFGHGDGTLLYLPQLNDSWMTFLAVPGVPSHYFDARDYNMFAVLLANQSMILDNDNNDDKDMVVSSSRAATQVET